MRRPIELIVGEQQTSRLYGFTGKWAPRGLWLLTFVAAFVGIARLVPYPSADFWSDSRPIASPTLFLVTVLALMGVPQIRMWWLRRELATARITIGSLTVLVVESSAEVD